MLYRNAIARDGVLVGSSRSACPPSMAVEAFGCLGRLFGRSDEAVDDEAVRWRGQGQTSHGSAPCVGQAAAPAPVFRDSAARRRAHSGAKRRPDTRDPPLSGSQACRRRPTPGFRVCSASSAPTMARATPLRRRGCSADGAPPGSTLARRPSGRCGNRTGTAASVMARRAGPCRHRPARRRRAARPAASHSRGRCGGWSARRASA